MSALLLALALTSAPIQSHDCRSAEQVAKDHGPTLGIRKLGALPDANEVRAVFRTVNGCEMAEVTRFHVSTPGGLTSRGVLVPTGGGRTDTGQGR